MDDQKNQEQLVHEAITEKTLENYVDECRSEFEKICNNYQKGFLSKEDVRQYFTGVFIKGFQEFVDKNNLKLIRPSLQSRWERFEDDYHLWKDGKHPCSKIGDLWLVYLRDGDGGIHAGDEASYIDKERFFSLMEVFRVPVDYYKPAPEQTVFSSRHLGRFPFEMIVGLGDYWQDDGGLLSEDFQLGNIVTLTDRYGLKATIKITEYLSKEEKRDRRVYSDYIGIGHIEGYTTSRDRTIGIDLYNGKIFSLVTEIGNDDIEEYSTFPLWQTELQYHYEINKVTWDVVESLIKKYFGESYDLLKMGDDEYPGFITYR